MMLEMAPEKTFGVLPPAFKGCEVEFALQFFASQGCTFLSKNRCELGLKCHADIEKEWNTPEGRALVVR